MSPRCLQYQKGELRWEGGLPKHCGEHREKDDVDAVSSRYSVCSKEGESKLASLGREGGRVECCAKHKADDHVQLKPA